MACATAGTCLHLPAELNAAGGSLSRLSAIQAKAFTTEEACGTRRTPPTWAQLFRAGTLLEDRLGLEESDGRPFDWIETVRRVSAHQHRSSLWGTVDFIGRSTGISFQSSNPLLSMRVKKAQADSHTFQHVVAREATQVGLGRTRLRSQATEESRRGTVREVSRSLLRALHFQLRGVLPTLDTAASIELALQVFDREVYAASSGGSFESRIRTPPHLLALWEIPLVPLVHECGTLCWNSSQGSTSSIGACGPLGDQLQGPLQDEGDSDRATPTSTTAADPLHPRGTPAPRRAAHRGLLVWHIREAELARATAALIRFRKATWSVPASKADPADAHPWMLLQEGHTGSGMLVAPSGKTSHSSEEIHCWNLRRFPTSSGDDGHDRSGSGSSQPTTAVNRGYDSMDWALLACRRCPVLGSSWSGHGRSSSLVVGGPELFWAM